MTFTAKEHIDPAASVAPESEMVFDAASAVIVPPQFPVRPFGVETTSPAGKVSVNPTLLNDRLEFGFARSKVSDVLPLSATLAEPKAFEIVGGSLTGGGALPEEPPPPQLRPAIAIMLRSPSLRQDPECKANRSGAGLLGMVDHFFFIWRHGLGLHIAVHLVIEGLHLVFCFLNLLE